MSSPTPILPTAGGYQQRCYHAEFRAEALLAGEGKSLGWDSHDDMVDFHQSFAPPWFKRHRRAIPDLVPTWGGSGVYNPWQHTIRLSPHQRTLVAYCHELGHALADAAGLVPSERAPQNGHNPVWAGMYLTLLTAADPHSAEVLADQYAIFGLDIEGYPAVTKRNRAVAGHPALGRSPRPRKKKDTPDDLLARLTANARTAASLDDEKLYLIAQAREAGLTLQEIADAYGTNKVTIMRWAARSQGRRTTD